MHRQRRQISSCFSLQTLEVGTCSFTCSLENRESLRGGGNKTLLLHLPWLSYTPNFGYFDVRSGSSLFNLLLPFAGGIIPWAAENWQSWIGAGEGQSGHPSWGSGPPVPGLWGAFRAGTYKVVAEHIIRWSRSSPGGRLVTTKPRAPPETETISALSKQLS